MGHTTVEYARERAQRAREQMRAAPLNSGAWLDAESSLRFWEARAAVLASHPPRNPGVSLCLHLRSVRS